MFTLPAAVLAQMRLDSQVTMRDVVSVYDLTITQDTYGQQTIASGLSVTTSGLFAHPREKQEQEKQLLQRLQNNGLLKQEVLTLLLPFGTHITTDQIVVSCGKEWDVVYTNDSMTDHYQLYVKTIVTRDIVQTPYKRKETKQ